MAMEYYDSINNNDLYIYYLNKNRKLLTNDDVISALDTINKQGNEGVNSMLFVDTNEFKINEKLIYDDMTEDDFERRFSANDNKSLRSVSVYNKKSENVCYI